MQHNIEITSPTYYKQAENGLLIHIYEHIVATQLDSYMRQRGHLFVVDYDLWGKTYGKTCFIETRFQTQEAAHTFKQALNQVANLEFTNGMLTSATISCSCEYVRPLMRLDDGLLVEMNQLNKLQWNTLDHFTFDQAHRDKSVNTVFEDKSVRYGRHTPQSFSEITFEYTVSKELFTKNSPLKALAILVIQAMALNQNGLFTDHFSSYDIGDEWNEGADGVGYRTHMRFLKKHVPGLSEIQNTYHDNGALILQNGFIEKLIRLAQINYADESLRYFDMQTLNTIAGGLIMGAKGWNEVATKSNIEKIIKNTNIKFITDR